MLETVPAKNIITKNKSTAWFGADYNMNIYRGCNHGCIYCDSRSDCYHIPDFDHVKAKADALGIIRKNLQSKTKTGVIATGAMSDPYNPYEKEAQLTRHGLELISAFGFGAAIATKSPLVTRDIDILKEIQQYQPALVKITITTLDDQLCRKLEPGVAPSSQRFAAIEKLAQAGICTGILLMPILPFINDTPENILGIVQSAREAGAQFIYPAMGVTLRSNQRDYFYQQLDRLFPGLAAQYRQQFGDKYSCSSPRGRELYALFKKECQRQGLLYRMPDIIELYQGKYKNRQISLFE